MSATPTYVDVIEKAFDQVNVILNHYVYQGYQNLSDHLRHPLGLAIVLYIMFIGVGMTQGWIHVSLPLFIKKSIKISLIYAFTMNWALFSHWVVDGIVGSSNQISQYLLSSVSLNFVHGGITNVHDALQYVFTEYVNIGLWIIRKSFLTHVTPLIAGLVIWVSGFSLVCIALFQMIISKIALALLMTVAPLFIGCALFPQTKVFFERWLGFFVGFSFLTIFIGGAVAIALSFVQWSLGNVYANKAAHVHLTSFFSIALISFCSVGIIHRVAKMALSMGISFSLSIYDFHQLIFKK